MKKVLSLFLTAIVFVNAFTLDVFAMQSTEKNLYVGARLLKNKIEKEFERKEEEIAKYITDHNYDYMLSMESYGNQKDEMYKSLDLISYIAAYAAIKESDKSIMAEDLSFLDVEYVPVSISYPEAVQTEKYVYEESVKGYVQEGYEYICNNKTIPAYKKGDNGIYQKCGAKKIIPRILSVKYVTPKIKPRDGLSVIKNFGITDEQVFEDYERRNDLLQKIYSGRGLTESFFISLPTELSKISISAPTINRESVLITASGLIGQVPYEWGGKSEKAGYDTSWWTIKESGKQKGLDCSGFVQWAFRSSGFPKEAWQDLLSTGSILKHCSQIDRNGLIPGDLGLLHMGEGLNHVGIYAGNGYFIHCSSKSGTVICERYENFHVFCRVNGIDDYKLMPKAEDALRTYNLTDEDIDLITHTVSHEAKGEGINGWIAVTEVILNRLKDRRFPSIVSEIIYSSGQFQNAEEIRYETPAEELKRCVRLTIEGRLAVLNDPTITYFKNAKLAGGVGWGNLQVARTIGNHTFYR